MAQSGDPKPDVFMPDDLSEHHDDDLIGFASPQSLEGRLRVSALPGDEPTPSMLSQPPSLPLDDPDLFDPPPVIRPAWGAATGSVDTSGSLARAPDPELDPAPSWGQATDLGTTWVDLHEPPAYQDVVPNVAPEIPLSAGLASAESSADLLTPARSSLNQATSSDRRYDFEAPPLRVSRELRSGAPMQRQPAAQSIEAQASLFTVYALILLIVPTFGVAGVIGLFAVFSRVAPTQTLALSHHIYQRRTLIIAAGLAIAGVFLMAAPFALGVITLFGVAAWVIVRGAWGLWRLKGGLPISNPRGLWI